VKIIALALVTLIIPAAAHAAPWQSINQRQANIEHRINNGINRGTLTRPEANRLRRQFRSLARLERRYRHNDLSRWERRDLNLRFDRLSRQVNRQKHDRQTRWNRHRR
jgi:hypothetical protein